MKPLVSASGSSRSCPAQFAGMCGLHFPIPGQLVKSSRIRLQRLRTSGQRGLKCCCCHRQAGQHKTAVRRSAVKSKLGPAWSKVTPGKIGDRRREPRALAQRSMSRERLGTIPETPAVTRQAYGGGRAHWPATSRQGSMPSCAKCRTEVSRGYRLWAKSGKRLGKDLFFLMFAWRRQLCRLDESPALLKTSMTRPQVENIP